MIDVVKNHLVGMALNRVLLHLRVCANFKELQLFSLNSAISLVTYQSIERTSICSFLKCYVNQMNIFFRIYFGGLISYQHYFKYAQLLSIFNIKESSIPGLW